MKNVRPEKIILLGLNALKRHKIRFIFVSFLFALTLSFFIFGLGVLRYDGASDTLNYYRESGRKHVSFQIAANNLSNAISNQETKQINFERRDEFKKLFPQFNFYPLYPQANLLKYPKLYRNAVNSVESGSVVAEDENALNEMGFRLNAGRLPKNDKEICISEFSFRLLCETGRVVSDFQVVPVIVKNYVDIIGNETFGGSGIKIVGVVDTFFDGSDIIPWIGKVAQMEPDHHDYNKYQNAIITMNVEAISSVAFPVFVSQEYAEVQFPFHIDLFTKLSGHNKTDLKLFKATSVLFQNGKVEEKLYNLTDGYTNNLKSNLKKNIALNDFGIKIMGIFGVFTMVMMFNFIGATIRTQQRQIGIYRALGMHRNTIFWVFSVESLLSAFIAFIASIGMSLGIATGYRFLVTLPNHIYPDLGSLFFPQWYIFMAGVGFAVLIALVGTFFPFIPTLKRKPSEIIRKTL